MTRSTLISRLFIITINALWNRALCISLRAQTSHFVGKNLKLDTPKYHFDDRSPYFSNLRNDITMRKQKASNKRTRRLQRGGRDEFDITDATASDFIASSLKTPTATSSWDYKSISSNKNSFPSQATEGGRGRSRKRSQLYNSLSSYHSHFLKLITAEFLAEEQAVRQRIELSAENPLALEIAGHALFDMYPERRGNIFSDEVYRLVKPYDATTKYSSPVLKENDKLKDKTETDATRGENKNGDHKNEEKIGEPTSSTNSKPILPPNHKFSQNDVIMITLQPDGTGDFFDRDTMPTNTDIATSIEARVLNTGPTYIDVAIPGGQFETKFGPAPNNRGPSGKGNPKMRLRADRYFSNVPYTRMVAALSQLTSIKSNGDVNTGSSIDENICQAILTTFAYSDPSSPLYQDLDACNMLDLARQLSKSPLKDSTRLTNEVLNYLQSNDSRNIFPQYNGPQLSCIGAALTRRLTMIQGPPGTGKTTVAASIAFGFVHQCRHISPNHKVLATAFSNCGADNLAEKLLGIGLKVVRVGKASAVSPVLWDNTLDAAIERDPDAKRAMEEATLATAASNQSRSKNGRSKSNQNNERIKRDIATRAVKASIEACNAAATKAMREADVIVCTSIGAADTRLLAACGIFVDGDDDEDDLSKTNRMAPDGLAPLNLPFVLIDEACQSVEPATLIPLLSTNSCRSLVMLGDPCQLPPVVVSDASGQGESPLSISLMSRLASTLPAPVIVTAQGDKTPKEQYFMNLKATRQAVSLIKYRSGNDIANNVSYRKQFAGALLLSVQYRMHASIAAFSSSVFYDGLLSTPSFLSQQRNLPRDFAKVLPIGKGTSGVRIVDVNGRNNERRGEVLPLLDSSKDVAADSLIANESISNMAEATQMIGFLKEVLENGKESKSPFNGSVGIITPYSAQVALIKSMMSQDAEFVKLVRENKISIEVNSVDAFQGRECDVILFSAVRSNRRDNVGFLCDWRRMNVALTRAKSGLILFGDMATLKRGDKHWEGFCTWADEMGCVFDVCSIDDDESMNQ